MPQVPSPHTAVPAYRYRNLYHDSRGLLNRVLKPELNKCLEVSLGSPKISCCLCHNLTCLCLAMSDSELERLVRTPAVESYLFQPLATLSLTAERTSEQKPTTSLATAVGRILKRPSSVSSLDKVRQYRTLRNPNPHRSENHP